MAYGTIKVDTITFTDAGVDKSVTISGLVQNPTFSGNITVTGTVSGNTIQGQTVSGATITGGAAAFTTVTGGVATITSGVFALGSASNPSISFTGDANSGLYSPGADQVAISTAGSGRLFVDASGNVGIGSSPTSSKLYVNGALETSAFMVSQASNVTTLDSYNYSLNIASVLNGGIGGNILFSTGSGTVSERLRITSAGLVGVGTSSPSTKLEISGSETTANFVTATTTFAGGFSGFRVRNTDTSGRSFDLAVGGSTAPTDQANKLYVYDNTANAQRITLDSSGRVGIGTTSPATTLNVQASAGEMIRAAVSSNTGLYANIGADGNGGWFGSNADLSFKPSGTERARIDSSGRLLVGTSSDSGGALLQVNSNRIRIATAKTPASATDTGTAGEICWDASYIYVCTATNTWKRTAIATW